MNSCGEQSPAFLHAHVDPRPPSAGDGQSLQPGAAAEAPGELLEGEPNGVQEAAGSGAPALAPASVDEGLEWEGVAGFLSCDADPEGVPWRDTLSSLLGPAGEATQLGEWEAGLDGGFTTLDALARPEEDNFGAFLSDAADKFDLGVDRMDADLEVDKLDAPASESLASGPMVAALATRPMQMVPLPAIPPETPPQRPQVPTPPSPCVPPLLPSAQQGAGSTSSGSGLSAGSAQWEGKHSGRGWAGAAESSGSGALCVSSKRSTFNVSQFLL